MRLALPLTGKFPRIALLAAVLAPFLLVVDLYSVHSPALEHLFSNILDFAIVLLAALCCVFVMRHSAGFSRQLWMLLAIALTVEAIGQALSTYYQYFRGSSLFSPIPSDIFFFIWVAPVFMIFLPRSDEDSTGFDWLRVLDFLQVAIVALTMYLYFFYTPSRWHSGEYSLIRQILIVYIARDLLLVIGFFLRSRLSVPSWFRSFCLFLAVVFLAAAISDLDFFYNLSSQAGFASWGDLIWMAPYLIVVYFALTWKTPESASLSLPRAGIANFFSQQFLPIGLPLLVIFMARAIAREQTFLGWFAVTASVLASSARLILTNRKTRRVAENLIATEKALHRSEEMLSTAFRSSPDSFSINIFPDGPYLEVNEGFTRLTGYTREETLDKTPSQLALWIDPSDRAKVLSGLLDSGSVRDHEFRFRTKSNQIRVGLMSASLIELDSRTCALVVVRDITARKEAENILRTSEERFRSLVQHLHVGILTGDPQGRILFANEALLELAGLSLEQVIGKTAGDLGIVALAEDGSVLPDYLRPHPRVLVTRQPIRSMYVGYRIPNRPDLWVLLDAVPEFSSTGEPVRVVMSLTDLTEQRRANEALRESEERFRTLVQDLHIGVALHQSDGRLEYANPAAYRMFNVPDGTATGKLISDYGLAFFDENGNPLTPEHEPLAAVLHTRAPVPNGLLAIRHAGSDKTLWAFGNAVPQFDSTGNVIRVITSFADVSEMKNAERAIHQLSTQLLRLQDEERRRIGRELHDGLAQTVLAINLSLAQVRDSLRPDEKAFRALEKARALTHQMSREIRTLSYLLHPPLLDDLGLVSALREYTQGFSERSSIDTQLYVLSEFGRLPQPIELALFRIVQESLANIQRHSGSASAKIRLHYDGELVTLEVVDFGHGIIARPDNSSKPGETRLGVGIPGMRERISQLGGRLDIISGPTGTTVRAIISLSGFTNGDTVPDVASQTM